MERKKFKNGDVVHIVKQPPRNCKSGWGGGMESYLGEEVVITDDDTGYEDEYHIDVDQGEYYWSFDCFQETYGEVVEDAYPDDSEIDSAMESLFDGFSTPPQSLETPITSE